MRFEPSTDPELPDALTADDLHWVNQHLRLAGQPPVERRTHPIVDLRPDPRLAQTVQC